MTLELTKEELEILQTVVYNEYLKQKYLSVVNEKEIPKEYTSLRDKLKERE